MQLKDRQKDILDMIIREHIKTAKPISSKEVVEELGFKASPATIRHEMLELDRFGYLEQPHTSAGRVPTDQGYRFFVDNLLEEVALPPKYQKIIKEVFQIKNGGSFLRELTQAASDFADSFAMAGVFGESLVEKQGFSKTLGEPEFRENSAVRMFGQFIDEMDRESDNFFASFKNEKVFIGEENKIKDCDCLSLLVSSWEHEGGFGGYLAVIGPRRMDYQKNISLFKYIHNINFN